MKRLPQRIQRVLLSAAVWLCAGSGRLLGQSAGFDLLQTAPGASVDLAAMGLGKVALKGVPIEACTGNTDTIMRRTKAVPSAGGDVPVEVFALFMKNAHPVKFKSQAVDVFVTINNSGGTIATSAVPQLDTLAPSTGTIHVRKNHTFDSKIVVHADLVFVKAGKSPAVAADVVEHQPAAPITLTSPDSTWSSKPFARYPQCNRFPSGGFYPRPKHRGPHPVTPSTVSKPAANGEKPPQ
jgi:hypothetical protein